MVNAETHLMVMGDATIIIIKPRSVNSSVVTMPIILFATVLDDAVAVVVLVPLFPDG